MVKFSSGSVEETPGLKDLRVAQDAHRTAIAALVRARAICAEREDAFEEAKTSLVNWEDEVRRAGVAIEKALKDIDEVVAIQKHAVAIEKELRTVTGELDQDIVTRTPVAPVAGVEKIELVPPKPPTYMGEIPADPKRRPGAREEARPSKASEATIRVVPPSSFPKASEPKAQSTAKAKTLGKKVKHTGCQEPGCKGEHRAKGYCVKHYCQHFPRNKRGK